MKRPSIPARRPSAGRGQAGEGSAWWRYLLGRFLTVHDSRWAIRKTVLLLLPRLSLGSGEHAARTGQIQIPWRSPAGSGGSGGLGVGTAIPPARRPSAGAVRN